MTSMAEQLAKLGLVSKEDAERIRRMKEKQLRDKEEEKKRILMIQVQSQQFGN